MKYLIVLFISILFLGCGAEDESNQNSTLQIAVGKPSTPPTPVPANTWYKPSTNTSWQWQLTGDINTSFSVELFDLDLFDTDKKTIDELHAQGKKVICYFSAGSYENWRIDKDDFDSSVLGNNLDGWAGEKWLNISAYSIRSIMTNRLDLAVKKGCDGVEPDNVDGYTNNSGFALSASDQLSYNKFLAEEAHNRGLSIGLKNDLDQVLELEPYFDFAINEQCHQYEECDSLSPFIENAKPVFNAEYKKAYVNNTNSQRDLLCEDSYNRQFMTLILPLNLDNTFRISCD